MPDGQHLDVLGDDPYVDVDILIFEAIVDVVLNELWTHHVLIVLDDILDECQFDVREGFQVVGYVEYLSNVDEIIQYEFAAHIAQQLQYFLLADSQQHTDVEK